MAKRIKILDPVLASKIAAGEVVERPSSVVKELLENSIDAKATSIFVHVAEGGRRLIRVSDNGAGMSKEDLPVAFLRHSTNKLSGEEDLYAIKTMGFRGEALSSISSVARVFLKTREREAISGASLRIEGGGEPQISEEGASQGTVIEIADLFYNTPARLKFMRSVETEFAKIADVCKRIALSFPNISFRLQHNSTVVFDSPAGTLENRAADLFGADILKGLRKVDSGHISGLIGSHELTYSTSKNIFTYVNSRWIKDRGVNKAVLDAYGQLLPNGRYPFVILDIKIPHEDVDVNIHPAKAEVRFKNQRAIYDLVKNAVRKALAAPDKKEPQKAFYTEEPALANTLKSSEPQPAAYGVQREFLRQSHAAHNDSAKKEETPLAPEFLELDIIGQLWGEFLLAQSISGQQEFFMIDQHAAAERVAFEELKKSFYENTPRTQLLLIPERFEATAEEAQEIKEAAQYFERIGFELMPFGPGRLAGETFLIKGVPQLLSSRQNAGLIKDLAAELAQSGGSSRVEDRLEDALMRIACHSVIRGARPLMKDEAKALLKSLSKVDFSGHCPHGRPVVKKLSRQQIDAFFKR